MEASKNVKHDEKRRQLASDVADFLYNGGAVYQATHEDTKMYRDRMKPKKKSKPDDHPMQIKPGATPNHIWRNIPNG